MGLIVVLVALSVHGDEPLAKIQAIDTSGFFSSIHHCRDLKDESRFIQVHEDQRSYSPSQVPEIVSNILLFQRQDGGWPRDYDMVAILSTEQREQVLATRERADSSYDNGNLHSQVEYLARAYSQRPEPEWRRACERGLDFIFDSQYQNGGFPQRFSNAKSYHAHITFNDGVMIGIAKVLRQVANNEPHFAWVNTARRSQANEALAKACECIFKCQILVNGRRTGWCQQHDEKTFEAKPARSFELESICPQETAEVVRFMMGNAGQSSNTLDALDAAVLWLKSVQIDGMRVERVQAIEETFLRHKADFDVVAVQDQSAKPNWARHYEIGTNRPFFCGRDGMKKYSLGEIERERRTGTAWYGGWPKAVLSEYAAWRKKQE